MLASRPTPEELAEAGILKGAPGMAPQLLDTAAKLQKEIRRNSLDQSLATRPTYEQIMEAGIAKGVRRITGLTKGAAATSAASGRAKRSSRTSAAGAGMSAHAPPSVGVQY